MWSKTFVIGNLGKDPEMKYTPSGNPVTNINVASNRKYKGKDGEWVKETIWYRAEAWGKLAETVNQYTNRGDLVFIEGRLVPDPKTGGPRIWQGESGVGASFNLYILEIKFLSGKHEHEEYASDVSFEGASKSGEGAFEPDDKIPF